MKANASNESVICIISGVDTEETFDLRVSVDKLNWVSVGLIIISDLKVTSLSPAIVDE